MCFSANASFAAAGIIGATGVIALSRVDRRTEVALAAMPLFFAIQQSIEGFLWLTLPHADGNPPAATLTIAFLLMAKVFWPIYAPWAPLLVEPNRTRRGMMIACAAMGAAVGLYFIWSMSHHSQTSQIMQGHIVYSGEPVVPVAVIAGYFIATCISAALSSHHALRLFAAIVAAGSVISYAFYWDAYSSVWCFFAAAASMVIVLHLVQARPLHVPATVPTNSPGSSD